MMKSGMKIEELGNFEIYLLFQREQSTFEQILEHLKEFEFQRVLSNNWEKEESRELGLKNLSSLFQIELQGEDEVAIHYIEAYPSISLTLVKDLIVVSFLSRPWHKFSTNILEALRTLARESSKALIGFELDFDIHNSEDSLGSLEQDTSNLPFIVHEGQNWLLFAGEEQEKFQPEFELLEEITSTTFGRHLVLNKRTH